jgi:dethiobiotin synthase
MNRDLFITGTDTNVGKTVLSALLCSALDAAYWKPIQTGTAEGTDRKTVAALAGLPADRMPEEAYVFTPPVSPHLAAQLAGTRVELDRIRRPDISYRLVIEGAGGVLVPINESEFMLDLMRRLGASIIVASRTGLGTINHTLLTVQCLRAASLPLRGVVLIGDENPDNRCAIERYGDVPVIGWIPRLPSIDRAALIEVFERHFEKSCFA